MGFLLVDEAIAKELQCGHTAKPFHSPPLLHFHCYLLGAVPKKDGMVSIILNLSSPAGSSVNDGNLRGKSFGLGPFRFLFYNAFASAVHWIIVHVFCIPGVIHYLDDFFVCASTMQ